MRVIEIVIEVLDATTGKLLAQTVQHGDPVLAFLPGNRAFGVTTDSVGRQIPVVWRVVH